MFIHIFWHEEKKNNPFSSILAQKDTKDDKVMK